MQYPRFVFSSCELIALATTFALVNGCADEDPRFGGAGAIKNIEVFDTPPATAAEAGPGGLSARAAFSQVWMSIHGYCGNCHAPPGVGTAPVFFGKDEQSSYDSFKSRNYHLVGGKPAGSKDGLTEHGAHTGNALTAAQQTLIAEWRAAEKASASDGGTSDGGDGG
jgi:hypothetical protein